MVQNRATNITHQGAVLRDEATKGQANNRLQNQLTHVKEQEGQIVKQAEERSSNRLSNIIEEVEIQNSTRSKVHSNTDPARGVQDGANQNRE